MSETLIGSAAVSIQLAATMQNVIDATLNLQAIPGITHTPATAITNGSTGANKANRFWQSSGRPITSGSSETLDLYDFGGIDIGAGAGNDIFGLPLTLSAIVAILIRNHSTSTGSLTIGGDGTTHAWNSPLSASDTATIGPITPDGVLTLLDVSATGFPVADVTNHLLKIAASGGNVTYDIFILGRQ